MLSKGGSSSNLTLITCATRLVYYGLLSSFIHMKLDDVDLTSVLATHLASLVSCVTGRVYINNVSGLVTILDSVKSKPLWINHQSLGSEETRALVYWLLIKNEKNETHFLLFFISIALK